MYIDDREPYNAASEISSQDAAAARETDEDFAATQHSCHIEIGEMIYQLLLALFEIKRGG